MINESTLRAMLNGRDIDISVKNHTASTNADMREWAKSSPARPALIVAESQSGGRGRMGRSFLSPEGGLYMTLGFPAKLPIERALGVTSCAAVAICRAIEAVAGAECGIKWVNDIYLCGGKLAGILVEAINDYEKMLSEYLIIGIGVNTGEAPYVDADYAISALHDPSIRERLCAAITDEIFEVIRSGADFSNYIKEYRRRSTVLGKEISFAENGKYICGTVVGITNTGALEVKCGDGTLLLSSGEISLRIKNQRVTGD